MPGDLQQIVPEVITHFVVVTFFSLLIGLEQRRHHLTDEIGQRFGTDRTFTLIGVLGFILYILSPGSLLPFLAGGAALTALLLVYYLERSRATKKFGITSLIIALITYCLAPLVYTQSTWLVLMIVVVVLVFTEIKKPLLELSRKFDEAEFITLAKFLVIAGIILPLLPDEPLSAQVPVSPYKFWLAIVAVSAISYFSYLLKKFVFPEAGILLTGVLGGLYSSTATTVILARKSREVPGEKRIMVAIMLATAMMYVRIFLLALFFNEQLAFHIAPVFAILTVLSAMVALFFHRFRKTTDQPVLKQPVAAHENPLEFRTSLLFGALFILFAVLTHYVTGRYGAGGINVLSFVVGVTDIDPFIINILQGKLAVADSILAMAMINATTSNNILKMVYGLSLSERSLRKSLVIGFGIIIIAGLLISFMFM